MKKISFILALIFGLFAFGNAVKADDSVGFTAQAILENHQKDNQLSYWWLNVKSGETIHLKLKIVNGAKKNSFDITANQAVTNQNLVTDYAQPENKISNFLTGNQPLNFYRDILLGKEQKTGQTELTLEPHQTIEFPVTVKIPENGINGQMIGGINVTQKADETARKNGLLNLYSIATALVLQEGKQPEAQKVQISPSNLTKDKQEISVKNPQQIVQKHVKISATIKDKNGKIYSEFAGQEAAIVPKTAVNVPLYSKIPLAKNTNYTMAINVEQNGKTQQNQNLQLNVDANGKITVKSDQKSSSNLTEIIVALIAVVLALIAGLFGWKIRKKQSM